MNINKNKFKKIPNIKYLYEGDINYFTCSELKKLCYRHRDNFVMLPYFFGRDKSDEYEYDEGIINRIFDTTSPGIMLSMAVQKAYFCIHHETKEIEHFIISRKMGLFEKEPRDFFIVRLI